MTVEAGKTTALRSLAWRPALGPRRSDECHDLCAKPPNHAAVVTRVVVAGDHQVKPVRHVDPLDGQPGAQSSNTGLSGFVDL
jgi:hypothetical protein